MSVALIKAALVLVVAWGFKIGATAPLPPATNSDKVYNGFLYEQLALFLPNLSWIFVLSLGFSNIAVLLAINHSVPYSEDVLTYLCPYGSPTVLDAIPKLTLPFLCGVVITTISALLRVWCFTTMGPMFTFEVTVRKEHKLVTTGPYAIVRHPSYTGVYLMLVGSTLTFFTSGSHVAECGVLSTPAGWGIAVCLLGGAWNGFSMWRRTFVEDALMKDMFGDQWLEYRDRVPYRLLPGIY